MNPYEIQPLSWIEKGKIRLDPVEWEAIKQAVERAFCEILADELHDIGESK